MWLGDLDGALAVADEARTAASVSENHMTAAIASAMFAIVAMLRGELDAANRVIEPGLSAAEHSPDRGGLRYPIYAPRAFILVEQDRLDEARSALEAGTRRSDEMGIRWHQPSYQMVGVVERFVAGEWDEAVDEVTANVELAADSGEAYTLIVSRGVHSLICLHRNDVASATELAQRAIRQLNETEGRYRSQWAVCAQALVLEAQGRVDDAYSTLAEAWEECSRLGLVLEYRVLAPDLVRLAVATGHGQRAEEATQRITALAAANNVPSLTGAALRCRGAVDGSLEPLQSAVAAYTSGPRVVELAGAREDLGVAFLRRAEPARGRPLLEEALATYERLGAQRDIARVEAVLRSAGIRRGSRKPRRRAEFGWRSLTPAEETVARLAAEGLTNPQIGERLFVSRRTVQTHMAHVFEKLGISSRSLLGAEVARQNAIEPTAQGS
jgi:ATP/maltotriose-dependent transcriptional regulator MalT